MGVTDVDPFIMGLTQAAGTLTPVKVAAGAILIAAASNNIVKGIYAYTWPTARPACRAWRCWWGWRLAGLVPLIWLGW